MIDGTRCRPARWALLSVVLAGTATSARSDGTQDVPAEAPNRPLAFEDGHDLPPGRDDPVDRAVQSGLDFLARDLTTQASGRVSLGAPEYEAPVGLTALAAAATPLRLPVGADAVSGIRTHSETLLADLARWESLSLSTTIDPS